MRFFQLTLLLVAALTACVILQSCGGAGESELAGTESLSATGSGDTTSGSPETEEPAPPAFRTENGLGFKADGYSSVEGGLFTLRKEFVITFDEPVVPGGFNRMSFAYSSTGPVKATVSYRLGTVSAVEVFYFEAGERAVFKGLISTCLDGMTGSGIDSIQIKPLKGTTKFELLSVSAEVADPLPGGVYYLENDRFRVGIRLSWGGGINCIEDKKCPVAGLSNLINGHDTGRLIQQSYYGTAGNASYTPGEFNGSKWSYNPVQGGDKYGNSSRLVDFEVSGDSVWVKAQPQDWSLNGKITPSYMENRYTLTDGFIRVDNRFVDFSGWEHRYAHQELPAFYTVSYLDRFAYYGGSAGWSGDTLTIKDGLPFWGDAAYANSCRFTMKKGNDETWCAWVSSTDNYGIGLYVPGIDQFYAGRFGYNGSKSASDSATNYVAPLLTLKLVSFKPVEYSYLIATGSPDEIRSVFYENRAFADNSSLVGISQPMR
ncbi:MAG: hypothetical protein J6V48_05875 [Clostridia bacterium]|nr:hypothetical protein [Clostridia bacterium]MBP5173995.1 hypothetical protein [Clostridia bacterium]